MNKPWTVLKEIASNNSRLHKEGVIAREAQASNSEFFEGVRAAVDNMITFGVKKVPVRQGTDGPGLAHATFIQLANRLAKRELTGHAALEAIEDAMDHATNEQWNDWYRLVLTKDLRAGFTESTVNKAIKGSANAKLYEIPTTPYMRCSLPDSSNIAKWDWTKGVFSQVKADGMFANVNVSATGDVWITSRAGTLFPEGKLGIEDAISEILKHGTQTHGELLVERNGKIQPREIGNGILNSILKGGDLPEDCKVIYEAWDQIPLDKAVAKGKYAVAYETRMRELCQQLNAWLDKNPGKACTVGLIENEIVYSKADALEHYRRCLERGLEGTVVKHAKAIWEDKTSKDQVKFKLEVDVDLEVVDFTEGNGKNAVLFGSMVCRTSDGLLEVGVSGFEDALRKEISDNREEWRGSIVTVKGNGLMKPSSAGKLHSIFLPRFAERRLDKDEADDLQKVIDQFNNAVKAI